MRGVGHFRLEAGERVLYDAELTPESEDPAAAFLNPPQRIFLFDAEAGQTVAVRLVHSVAVQGLGALFGLVSFELGYGAPAVPDEELIQRAVFAAEEADSALVFVGTTDDSESEGSTATPWPCPAARTSWSPGSPRSTPGPSWWSTRAPRC